MPTNWWHRQNAALLKFDPNFGKCRSEVSGDVISGVADIVVLDFRMISKDVSQTLTPPTLEDTSMQEMTYQLTADLLPLT